MDDISYSTEGGRFGDAHLVVDITITDGGGQPVSGASVSADLNLGGAFYASKSGTTGPDGSVALKFTNAPAGCYDTVDTAITAAGLSWDSSFPANSFAKGGAGCP